MALTHALVVKLIDEAANDVELVATIASWWHRHGAMFADVHAHRGVASADVYIYLELAAPAAWPVAERQAFEATLTAAAAMSSGGLTTDRLECVFDVSGASMGEPRALHYVVETDAADGWQNEMWRWYDTEHMPGLASVPGCIRARRFINHDRGPRSFACYDLARAGVTESAPWLAVRASAWSDRVRPQFCNARRTMFRELPLPWCSRI